MKTCDVCDKPTTCRHDFDAGHGVDGGQRCCRCHGCEKPCDAGPGLRETLTDCEQFLLNLKSGVPANPELLLTLLSKISAALAVEEDELLTVLEAAIQVMPVGTVERAEWIVRASAVLAKAQGRP